MYISKLQAQYIPNYSNLRNPRINKNNIATDISLESSVKLPATFHYSNNITFGEFFDPNRTVPHIDYEEYMAMKPATKQRFRKVFNNFPRKTDAKELFDPKSVLMPLRSEKNVEEFIKTASIYKKYKNNPIICLGRSPKWFLNAALWMKDGIPNYDFVAFSGFWFWPDRVEGMKKMENAQPTEKEIAAYRKYLKRLGKTPQRIVEHFNRTGEKTVITDYISTGKGMTSFLEIMSDYADEKGILEQFAKSIQIVGIGSMDYMEEMQPFADSISEPRVIMPPKLQKYQREIKQEFYNMDYLMFHEMLINQNTNECRSSYYPHSAWTIYKPDRFKTGLIKDMKKVKEHIKSLGSKKTFSSFTPAMLDYRNLLNFRILDALNQRGLLKAIHHSKL